MKHVIMAAFAATAILAGGAVALNQAGDTVAHAQSSAKAVVDAAKARGEVAERIDGYLEARASAPADVKRAVDEINIGRKSVYTQTARQNNARVEVIAQLAGEKQLSGTPSGQYVIGADGQWTRK
ncbi:MAG: YdbL family protein [Litorimonas sp.]